ncbi:hypothetical protein LTR17_027132 [Elasticomyces elasticus]|nr:hypothetical protein LTR17_027132 [Elasticomyces elasticus]
MRLMNSRTHIPSLSSQVTTSSSSSSAFDPNTPAPSTPFRNYAETLAAVALAVQKLIRAGDHAAAEVIKRAELEAFDVDEFGEVLVQAVDEAD